MWKSSVFRMNLEKTQPKMRKIPFWFTKSGQNPKKKMEFGRKTSKLCLTTIWTPTNDFWRQKLSMKKTYKDLNLCTFRGDL